ncbi:2-aminoethanethiol dioxygenase-like [Gigantopelta aegis]|uniref:2-aminoethanethiol dioxygenase-like n=1 Tax=Gigantopelta aegis TaxID=1735272 RepID=UPI001B88DA8A|nr:2-aminoethanethiol dioxygenase-like [Gigantopelta aegis]
MAAPIQKIARLAFHVFSRKQFDGTFHEGLKSLKSMLNNITSKELNFDVNSLKRNPTQFEEAPVGYVSIWEDDVISIGVFVVKPNGRLPLHDHPGMHGLIRVIHGALNLKSFTETSGVGVPSDLNRKLTTPQEKSLLKPAVLVGESVVSTQDECCVLTPTDGNIHEIRPVGETVAFLDVLSPPYGDSKDCNYYSEMSVTESENQGDGITWLLKIPSPADYWCETFDYTGPVIDEAQFDN